MSTSTSWSSQRSSVSTQLPQLKMVSPVIPGGYLMSAACLAIWLFVLAFITTLHHLYDTTGDAEAIGPALVLSSFCGVASIVSIVKGT